MEQNINMCLRLADLLSVNELLYMYRLFRKFYRKNGKILPSRKFM